MHYKPILFIFLLSLLSFLKPALTVNPSDLADELRGHINDRKLFLFDNDGVLKPDQGRLEGQNLKRARTILTTLAADPKNEVWVITGRSMHNLEGPYGHIPNLNLASELGGVVRRANQPEELNYDYGRDVNAMAEQVIRIVENRGGLDPNTCLLIRPTGTVMLQKHNVPPELKWHCPYLEEEMEKLAARSRSKFNFRSTDLFAVLTHNESHKGKLASQLLQEHPDHFVLTLGDADIDQPMFNAVKKYSEDYRRVKALSVLVGNAPGISADRRLDNHIHVYEFFENWLGI